MGTELGVSLELEPVAAALLKGRVVDPFGAGGQFCLAFRREDFRVGGEFPVAEIPFAEVVNRKQRAAGFRTVQIDVRAVGPDPEAVPADAGGGRFGSDQNPVFVGSGRVREREAAGTGDDALQKRFRKADGRSRVGRNDDAERGKIRAADPKCSHNEYPPFFPQGGQDGSRKFYHGPWEKASRFLVFSRPVLASAARKKKKFSKNSCILSSAMIE